MGLMRWLPERDAATTASLHLSADLLQWGPSDLDPDPAEFSNAALVHAATRLKTLFDDVEPRAVNDAARATNPLESLGNGTALNRCGFKLAEILHVIGGAEAAGLVDSANGDPPAFVDLCGGPGGFTQHLFRACPTVRGWGFTLKDRVCDWKLDRVGGVAGQRLLRDFTVTYGDGSGDILTNGNARHLAGLVRKARPDGVDLVTADGGAPVGNEYNRQEYHLRRLVLAQMATALAVLRRGGTFVCKVFDMRSRFTVSLVALLHLHFERAGVLKPYTSRPANAERYLIFQRLDAGPTRVAALVAHLHAVNSTLAGLQYPTPGGPAGHSQPLAIDIVGVAPIPAALQAGIRHSNRELESLACRFLERTVTVLSDPETMPKYAALQPTDAEIDALRQRLLV
jgi:23S rRNA U2552 (ribose-2'-O)-methylase RlmE/FtsJ